jgi:hypothetical protein
MTLDFSLLYRAARICDGASVHDLSSLLLAYGWLVDTGKDQMARTAELQIRAMLARAELTDPCQFRALECIEAP